MKIAKSVVAVSATVALVFGLIAPSLVSAAELTSLEFNAPTFNQLTSANIGAPTDHTQFATLATTTTTANLDLTAADFHGQWYIKDGASWVPAAGSTQPTYVDGGHYRYRFEATSLKATGGDTLPVVAPTIKVNGINFSTDMAITTTTDAYYYLDTINQTANFIAYSDEVVLNSALVPRNITAGDNTQWQKGSSAGLQFKADIPAGQLDVIEIDGVNITPVEFDNQTAPGDPDTTIVLKAAYLQTLSEGNHTISFVALDTTRATGHFEIKSVSASSLPTLPNTGIGR